MNEYFINDSFKIKWVNSSVTPTLIQSRVYDENENVVHSMDMVSSGSGSGFYYQFVHVETPGYYVAETYAEINSNPYTKRSVFKAVRLEV